MRYTENAINVLTARTFKGIGRAWFAKNWHNSFTNVADIVQLLKHDSQEDIISIEKFEEKRETILAALTRSEQYIDGVVAIGDDEFPQYRGNVKHSERPIFLFYKGDLSLLSKSNLNIAVIGLLTPTVEIEQREQKIVAELVKENAVIVSGLALGCDTIAHKQTLEMGGKTIAILPSPLSNISPASNRDLAHKIVEQGGLLITEYLTVPKNKRDIIGRYQERDRLQALFSDCVLLSASYAKNDQGLDSGSRLALGYASDYNIPRAVLYSQSEDANPMYDLNRHYMRDQSVIVVNEQTMREDIELLFPRKKTLF
ncbi:MAG: DNA-binding protein [Rikenellaceae bacterium]|nr:DNA-binding protein [Rikenellaceae bacterium]